MTYQTVQEKSDINTNRNTIISIKYLKLKKILTVKKPVNHFENHKIYKINVWNRYPRFL
jgi:hypothetical protein